MATTARPTDVHSAEWIALSPTACSHHRVVNPGGGQVSDSDAEKELMTTTPSGT